MAQVRRHLGVPAKAGSIGTQNAVHPVSETHTLRQYSTEEGRFKETLYRLLGALACSETLVKLRLPSRMRHVLGRGTRSGPETYNTVDLGSQTVRNSPPQATPDPSHRPSHSQGFPRLLEHCPAGPSPRQATGHWLGLAPRVSPLKAYQSPCLSTGTHRK